jgi:hypothetical protein
MAKSMFLLNELPTIHDVRGIIKFFYYNYTCIYTTQVNWDLTIKEIELLEEHLIKELKFTIGINLGSGVNHIVYKPPIFRYNKYQHQTYIDARDMWTRNSRLNPFTNIYYWLNDCEIIFENSIFNILCRKLYYEHQSNS